MKLNFKVFLYGVVFGAAAFVLVQFAGCAVNTEKETIHKEAEAKAVSEKKHSCCEEMEEDEYSENSIYQLESKWKDQSGNTVKLKEFKGKPVVLTMFFASCTYACPVLVNDMKRIEGKAGSGDYRYVLVSIDPENDTPEKLNEYARKFNLDLKKWTLLTGEKDDVQELAAVLGFKYKKDGANGYSHSNLINIINDEGEIVYQHTGLNQDVTIAADKLNNNTSL